MNKSIYGQCSVCKTYIELESKVDKYFCPSCKKTRKIQGTIQTANMPSGLMDKIQVQVQIKRQYRLLSGGTLPKGCDMDETACEKALDSLENAISLGEKLLEEDNDKVTKNKIEQNTYLAYAEKAYALAKLNRRDEAKEAAEIAKSHLKSQKDWLNGLLRDLEEED